MDLSFEDENNFNLPDPAGKLDFTEDEEINRKNEDKNCDLQGNFEEQDCSMNDQMNESDQNESDTEKHCDESPVVEFNRPIINQNLMLNKNKKNGTRDMFVTNKTGHQEPVTPALIKRKQFKQWFNSPTDNCLSPCTQKLFKTKKPN